MMDFPDALRLVLELEGGKSNVQGDRGGKTNYGITQIAYDDWRKDHDLAPLDVFEITKTEAEAIYRERYWYAAGCDKIPGRLGVCVFQAAVHSGVGNAKAWLEDVRWAEALEECQVFAFLSVQRRFLINLSKQPDQGKFRKGWENRILKTLAFTMRVT